MILHLLALLPVYELNQTANCDKNSHCSNTKEVNDQESINFPNTFRPRHQRKRKTHFKQRHHNENTTSRKAKGQFLSHNLAKRQSKIKISPEYTCKPQQKHRLETVIKI